MMNESTQPTIPANQPSDDTQSNIINNDAGDLPEPPAEDAAASDEPDMLEVSFEDVETLLKNGTIVEDHGRVRWSSNHTMLLTVQDDPLQTLAIYKPQRGERPLWDFPEGTLCYREVAAYEVSKALGWDLVAPTVLREGNAGIGSVQLFIKHDPQITYFQLSDDFIPELKHMAAFDYIVNNTDRKGGHCLVDPNGKLWGIDHGICFHAHPKLRTVIWDFAGEPLPETIIKDVEALCMDLETANSPLMLHLKELISSIEINAFRARVQRLIERAAFPKPGAGPNYPWPAV